MSNQIQVPHLSLGDGLFVVVGGWCAIDARDEKAVILHLINGTAQLLSESQSETFLIQIGLKQQTIIKAVPPLNL